ncbi:class I SAM-dependent methyltransferase [Methylacidimicrobium cyclopophantes]|uniref:class I SAM-dependent methyltransferase n=1 Tax=Methylacidimicrobium cyclopophantes TaxID=1041766 RepID=UPI0015B3AA25|nr:class I SAM-dependent methyltransferase [Methylacidimicrobium cyclopophantes]
MEGEWNYRRCDRCGSLWMDPRPPMEAIPTLYPENYYTHAGVPPDPAGERSLPSRVWGAAQEAALRRFGYNGAKPANPWERLGEMLLAFPPIEREAPRRVRFLPRLPSGKLLDVGCGDGSFLERMRTLGWEGEGLEPDPISAEQARRRGFPIRSSTLEEAAFPPEAYDAITMSHVLEHLPDPSTVLVRLRAALKRGGLLVSISPNPVGSLARRFGGAWRGLEPPRHLVLPSPAGCAILCRKAELEARVFTCWSESHWVRSQSRQIETCGRVLDTRCPLADRLYGYAIAPWMNWFLRDSGEEVVFVAHR